MIDLSRGRFGGLCKFVFLDRSVILGRKSSSGTVRFVDKFASEIEEALQPDTFENDGSRSARETGAYFI